VAADDADLEIALRAGFLVGAIDAHREYRDAVLSIAGLPGGEDSAHGPQIGHKSRHPSSQSSRRTGRW
jgi:hypothetical protein